MERNKIRIKAAMECDRISIMEKPSEISFDEIHDLLWAANEANRESGFVLNTSLMDGAQLEARLGKNGKCFVALDGSRLVGTVSVRFIKRNAWYARDIVADYMMAAVLPEYRGRHINSRLSEKVFSFCREKDCLLVELDTAEGNRGAIAMYRHYGFRQLAYKANPGGDHYSVIMAKWLEDCPFPAWYCQLRFLLNRLSIRLRYTEARERRFGI